MLIKNPITELLYDYDYKGLENIFDYWIKHREPLLFYINKNKRKIKDFPEEMLAFELKIRWSSFYGMLYRFHLKMYLREQRNEIEFDKLLIKYGKQYLLHRDFIDKISMYVPSTDLLDLRGVSLLRYQFKSTVIKNVDFSYSALNDCQFDQVSFVNCRFNKTTFNRSTFNDCHFDAACLFSTNDFSRAFIKSEFDCKIYYPILLKANWKVRVKSTFGLESNILEYTKIESSTFYEKWVG